MDALAYADVMLRVLELLAPALVRESAEFSRMRLMVAEEREPTREEWDALFANLRADTDRLRAAVARLEQRDAALES